MPKNHLLFKEGRTVRSLCVFLKKGIVRAFKHSPHGKLSFGFGQEGAFLVDYNSYVHELEGYASIELLSVSTIAVLQLEEWKLLCTNYEGWHAWARKWAEHGLIKTEHRFIERQYVSATDHYLHLLETQPERLQHISLGIIAPYLGITPVSLSRIRAHISIEI